MLKVWGGGGAGNRTATVPLTGSHVYGLWLKHKGSAAESPADQLPADMDAAVKERLHALDSIVHGNNPLTLARHIHLPLTCAAVGALALRYDIRIPTNRQPTKFGIGQTLDYAHPFLSRIAFVQQFEGTAPVPCPTSGRECACPQLGTLLIRRVTRLCV